MHSQPLTPTLFLQSTIDERDSPRAALPPPPPPPAYIAIEVPQAQEFDGDREIEANEEAGRVIF